MNNSNEKRMEAFSLQKKLLLKSTNKTSAKKQSLRSLSKVRIQIRGFYNFQVILLSPMELLHLLSVPPLRLKAFLCASIACSGTTYLVFRKHGKYLLQRYDMLSRLRQLVVDKIASQRLSADRIRYSVHM